MTAKQEEIDERVEKLNKKFIFTEKELIEKQKYFLKFLIIFKKKNEKLKVFLILF